MASDSSGNELTDKQLLDFLEATNNMVCWEGAVVFMKEGESIFKKDITYEDAMYLLTTEDYICVPF